MSFLYLIFLLGGIGCMVLLDRRFRLFFWRNAWRAAAVLAIGLAFFVAWDASGISQGIFSLGETRFMTGVLLGYQFPLEELFFLGFLCYLTMILVTGLDRLIASRRRVGQ